MKIVGFEQDKRLHLGVVEGDQVIDLQAVDPKIPADLGEVLARSGGDLKVLADAAKSAPASARRSLAGIQYSLPVAAPGKIVALIGVEDLVVVDTPDALLVMPRSKAQDVRAVVEALRGLRDDAI